MMKKALIAILAATALAQVPVAAQAAPVQAAGIKPMYTMCALFPWLPSCRNMMGR